MLQKNLRLHLATFCSEEELRRWFDPLCIRLLDEHRCISVEFPHQYFYDFFTTVGKTHFEQHTSSLFGKEYSIQYTVKNAIKNSVTQRVVHIPTPLIQEEQEHIPVSPATLDSFICNDKNSFPLAAIKEFVTNPKKQGKYNPFIICGESGCGKTHLLHGIYNELQQNVPKNTIYFGNLNTLATLCTEYSNNPGSWYQAFTNTQYILLDNLHQFKTFPELQEYCISIFDWFMQNKHTLIATLTGKTSEWDYLHPALRSRLEEGLVVEVKKADLDIRVRYAVEQCRKRKIPLQKEHILILAQRYRTIRNLQGVLIRIEAFHKLEKKKSNTSILIDAADLEQILKYAGDDPATHLVPEKILSVVAQNFSLTTENLLSKTRVRNIVYARQIAMFLCRDLLGLSYPALGRLFGGKNHATSVHSVKKIQQLHKSNKDTQLLVTELKKKCLTKSD